MQFELPAFNHLVVNMERKWTHVLVGSFAFIYLVFGECHDPSNVEEIKVNLQGVIKDTYLNYMSFFNIKSNLERVKGQLDTTFVHNNATSDNNQKKAYISRLYGEPRCKKRRRFRAGVNHTTSEMSSCPWYYILEFDNDRIPVTVLKAKCSCSNCLVPIRSGYKRDLNSSGGYCKEVSYHMPVIRRDCVRDEYRYRIAIENIPVGCTCQRCNRKKKQGTRTLDVTS